jgi:DNA repair ATPase RecN
MATIEELKKQIAYEKRLKSTTEHRLQLEKQLASLKASNKPVPKYKEVLNKIKEDFTKVGKAIEPTRRDYLKRERGLGLLR